MSKLIAKKAVAVALAVTAFAAGISFGSSSQASMKTKIRYQNIADSSYSVTKKNATVYSSATLAHKKGTLKSFGSKVTGYYSAHVTKKGKIDPNVDKVAIDSIIYKGGIVYNVMNFIPSDTMYNGLTEDTYNEQN